MKPVSPTLRPSAPHDVGISGGDTFGKCMGLLGGKTDEEKFAGLLLVTRTVRSDDSDAMGEVLSTIGLAFILRLLASPGSPGDAADEAGLYTCMALNLLSSFCLLPELLERLQCDRSFVSISPHVTGCIANPKMSSAWRDAHICLLSLASNPQGQENLCKDDAPKTLARWLAEQHEDSECKTLAVQSLDLLLDPHTRPHATAKAVPFLAEAMNKDKTTIKLDLVDRLHRILTSHDAGFALEIQKTGRGWDSQVRESVMELIQNKAHGPFRHQLLAISLGMCLLRGPSWAIPDLQECGEHPDGRAVQMLIGMSKIELRLALEEKELPQGSDRIVPICLALLEKALDFLSDESEDAPWAQLSAQALLYIKNDLEESVDAVTGRLVDWMDDWDKSSPISEPLFLPLVRFFSYWLLQVTSDKYTRQLQKLMPLLCRPLDVNAAGKDAVLTGAGIAMQGEGGGLWMLLPALSSLSSESEIADALVVNNGHIIIAKMIQEALGGDGGAVASGGLPIEDMLAGEGALINACEVLFNIYSLRPPAAQEALFLSVASSIASFAELLASHNQGWQRGSIGIGVVAAVGLQCLRYSQQGSLKSDDTALRAADMLLYLLAERVKDGSGEEDVETDMIGMCFEALLDGSKRHFCLAERVAAVQWPKGGKGCFGFELQQVGAMLEAMDQPGGLALHALGLETAVAESHAPSGGGAGGAEEGSHAGGDSLESLD
mmetsp:Transcript_50841/g.123861  ORF Transcript_50841/g.123861 Transcript_50841/m.123861 type:complete len:719 (+) Transcript_50841:177-2333(+)